MSCALLPTLRCFDDLFFGMPLSPPSSQNRAWSARSMGMACARSNQRRPVRCAYACSRAFTTTRTELSSAE